MMMLFRSLSEQVLIHSILFASRTLAVLHNVTVDDATTTGAVVPQYSPGFWNIGNTCPGCLAQPDPSQVYNRTWHDATFHPSEGLTQTIDFSYTGSSIYIFFILANSIPYVTTNTNVDFVLDGNYVGRYDHTPSNSTDYEYNVLVYINDSVTQGFHRVLIQPATSLNVSVLILFDYLIYTTDTDSSSSVSLSVRPTSTPAALPSLAPFTTVESSSSISLTPTSSQGIGSNINIGAIAGGTVSGVAMVTLFVAFLLCYWGQRRRNVRPAAEESDVVDPFTIVHDIASAPLPATIPPAELSVTNMASNKRNASALTPQTSNPPTTTVPTTAAAAPSSSNATLREEVEILRDEVVRLWRLRDGDQNDTSLPLDPPPEYSI